jgi:hypothetical protein
MPFEPDAEGGAVPNRQASIGNTRDWRKTILALEHFSSEPASQSFASEATRMNRHRAMNDG